jgi:nucleoside-diphosphate-sugar epimerase
MQNKIIGITGHKGNLAKSFIKEYPNNSFIYYNHDIICKKKLEKWICKSHFDIFIHFAALVSIKRVNKNYKSAYKTNYLGTKNVIDSLIKYKKKCWFFFSSTAHIYKTSRVKIKENSTILPLNFYGKTKLKAENYIRKKKYNYENIKICIGRIFSPIIQSHFDKDYFLPNMYYKIKKKNNPIYINDTDKKRDFVSTKDISKAINSLYAKNCSGIFNIASGKGFLLSEIIKKLYFISYGVKPRIYFKKKNLSHNLVANISKIKRITNWRPNTNINYLLKKFINSMKR